jgi:DNA-directed RNA polymerase specialized sigma24 family protein
MVQDAYMRFLAYQRSVPVRDPDALLRRIVINLSITCYHLRRASPLVSESIGALDRRGKLIDPTPGPERTLAAEQELDAVVNLLSTVTPRTCQIFIAQRAGYHYEEIAEAFAIKRPTVDKHVATATWNLEQLAAGRALGDPFTRPRGSDYAFPAGGALSACSRLIRS